MNKVKSILRLTALCLILSAGLFACKSSKKVADATQDSNSTEKQMDEADDKGPNVEMKKTSESKKKELKVETISVKLVNYFNEIANASNNTAEANRYINEAKTMFASADTPVLIIINESSDGSKDYDQPTNILDYMNYLKDQGKNLNNIFEVKTNDRGRITELVLIRK